MSLSDDLNELVSAYLDGETTAAETARVEADPELLQHVEELREVSERVGAPVVMPSDAIREAAIAAALRASATSPKVTSIATASQSTRMAATLRRTTWERYGKMGSLVAAAVAGIVVISFGLSSLGSNDSRTSEVADTSAVSDSADSDVTEIDAGKATNNNGKLSQQAASSADATFSEPAAAMAAEADATGDAAADGAIESADEAMEEEASENPAAESESASDDSASAEVAEDPAEGIADSGAVPPSIAFEGERLLGYDLNFGFYSSVDTLRMAVPDLVVELSVLGEPFLVDEGSDADAGLANFLCPDVIAEASLGWDEVSVYGFALAGDGVRPDRDVLVVGLTSDALLVDGPGPHDTVLIDIQTCDLL